MRKNSGFTLVELLIVVAIIGILAAIALPSYNDSVRKGKRADGKASLSALANALERCYTQNGTYDGCAAAATNPQDSSDGYYSIAINTSAGTPTQFSLTATGQNGQENDTGCTALTLDQINSKGPAACW